MKAFGRILLVTLLALPLAAQQQPDKDMSQCPMHKQHQQESAKAPDSHFAGVDTRGDQAMGFDHTKTTHHFLLTNAGGVIRVEANTASDDASANQIRMHLRHISQAFAQGDFSIPMFVHDATVPGVQQMKALGGQIQYQYREIPRGGEVEITSNSADAIAAVHDFLKFQIEDHRTGDSETVTQE